MRMKKQVAFFLALLMLATTLVGCGSGSGNGSGQSDLMEEVTFPLEESMSFSAISVMNGQYSLKDNLAWNTALERANIEFELTSVLNSEITEKTNLLLNSGAYPEVFIKTGVSANQYGLEGILIPLEDLIRKYAPNLTAWLDETDGWSYITSADGHVYSLPAKAEESPRFQPYWINKKWLDNLGLEEPKSFEELYQVLKAFKEQDANGNGDPSDEIPYTACTDVSVNCLLAYENYSYDDATKMAIIDDEFTYVPMHESYKEFLAYCRKLYSEGLMDKNAFTNNISQQRAIGQSKDVLGSFCDTGGFQTVGRDNDDDYVILTPFYEETYPLVNEWTANALVITDACEHPEVIVAWADYFYTEEGARLSWMGVEDETYKVNEDGTWDWILSEEYGEDVATLRAKNTIQGTKVHPAIVPELWQNMSGTLDPDEVYLNEQRKKVYDMGTVPVPALSYTEEERETYAVIRADVDSYIDQYCAQVVTGQRSLEDSWDEYISTLKAMNVEKMIEIYTAAYERAIN